MMVVADVLDYERWRPHQGDLDPKYGSPNLGVRGLEKLYGFNRPTNSGGPELIRCVNGGNPRHPGYFLNDKVTRDLAGRR